MIVDTSALVAILRKEDGFEAFADVIMKDASPLISACTLLESAMVEEGRRGEVGARELDALVVALRLSIAPFTAEHAALAREAFRRFGKGRHPARLNFGDCMAYALAKERGEPLLFKGDDFSQTDIEVAAY